MYPQTMQIYPIYLLEKQNNSWHRRHILLMSNMIVDIEIFPTPLRIRGNWQEYIPVLVHQQLKAPVLLAQQEVEGLSISFSVCFFENKLPILHILSFLVILFNITCCYLKFHIKIYMKLSCCSLWVYHRLQSSKLFFCITKCPNSWHRNNILDLHLQFWEQNVVRWPKNVEHYCVKRKYTTNTYYLFKLPT